MEKSNKNPFRVNPEQVLQDRMKHARKITRDEFFQSSKAEEASIKGQEKKKK
jgi:hypothetical protein